MTGVTHGQVRRRAWARGLVRFGPGSAAGTPGLLRRGAPWRLSASQ